MLFKHKGVVCSSNYSGVIKKWEKMHFEVSISLICGEKLNHWIIKCHVRSMTYFFPDDSMLESKIGQNGGEKVAPLNAP